MRMHRNEHLILVKETFELVWPDALSFCPGVRPVFPDYDVPQAIAEYGNSYTY